MNTNGSHFKQTLEALKLEGDEKTDAIRNAKDIVTAIIKAYAGDNASEINPANVPPKLVTGLVYGRIQSGKTRAMIVGTAMAFDNKFRVAVVMTSNINDLVNQTHVDFLSGLPGLMIFTKDSDLEQEIESTKLHLSAGDNCLLLVCSKATKSLKNISDFLEEIDADILPTIIFDDEGDQASLDTNTRKRSRSHISVASSPVNNVIQNELRVAVPRHVYVSVTGTPQAVLLQSAESSHRPSFIVMLPPGLTYVGGDAFFNKDEPEENETLIALVDPNEKQLLLNKAGPIPPGMRRSILFFLISASAAIKNLSLGDRGYSYLCHPSLRNDEQEIAQDRIGNFLTEVAKALYQQGGDPGILDELKVEYENLTTTLGNKTPAFDELKTIILQQLATRRILVINARVKRQGIAYGKCLNFLIGGNTLGRGIAIRDLLVTYYVRASVTSQIDTMHQHARMYGYRRKTIDYTRLFITREIYYRFRDIYRSDEDLRTFIETHKDNPATFPIEYTYNLRPSRPGVLDVKKTDTLNPAKQIYPNYIVVPQTNSSYNKVLSLLRQHFDAAEMSEEQMEAVGKQGKTINIKEAQALVAPIKTHSKNTWRDRSIALVIEKVADKFAGKVMLRFRTAERTVPTDGFMSTGTLFGGELTAARQANIPTLWMMAVKTKAGSPAGGGLRFMYPTWVIPQTFPNLFMFNRG